MCLPFQMSAWHLLVYECQLTRWKFPSQYELDLSVFTAKLCGSFSNKVLSLTHGGQAKQQQQLTLFGFLWTPLPIIYSTVFHICIDFFKNLGNITVFFYITSYTQHKPNFKNLDNNRTTQVIEKSTKLNDSSQSQITLTTVEPVSSENDLSY